MTSNINLKIKNIITILGTTGVGKSQFAVAIARAVNGEIINADSMAFYAGVDAISAKPSISEQKNVPHHLIGIVPWNSPSSVSSSEFSYSTCSAHWFSKEGQKIVQDVLSRGKVPILVGGTHYYLQALLFKTSTLSSISTDDESNGYDKSINNKPSFEINERELTEEEKIMLDTCSTSNLWNKLREIDPVIANKFHPNDRRKLKRLLEIYLQTGSKPSDLYSKQKKIKSNSIVNSNLDSDSGSDSNSKIVDLNFRTISFWLYSDFKNLDKRLDSRVDKMLSTTLDTELNDLYKSFLSLPNDKQDTQFGVYQIIGFKEFLPYLNKLNESKMDSNDNLDSEELKKLKSLGVSQMKSRTRKYARTQVKWIRKKYLVEMNNASKASAQAGEPGNGLVCLLDASSLQDWEKNVEDRGIYIAKKFLSGEDVSSLCLPDNDNKILTTMTTKDEDDQINSFKTLLTPKYNTHSDSPESWKHFTCTLCTSANDKNLPYVAVGSDAWNAHLRSRRHRVGMKKNEKKKNYENWLAKKALS